MSLCWMFCWKSTMKIWDGCYWYCACLLSGNFEHIQYIYLAHLQMTLTMNSNAHFLYMPWSWFLLRYDIFDAVSPFNFIVIFLPLCCVYYFYVVDFNKRSFFVYWPDFFYVHTQQYQGRQITFKGERSQTLKERL